MCSQFENLVPIAKLAKYSNSIFDDQVASLIWEPHVYPYAKAPVVTRYEQYNSIRLMSYSLVPAWSKTAKPKFSTYNARLDRPGQGDSLELIYNTPTWRRPFLKQRCLVPLSGFFESCRVGTHVGNIVKFTANNSDDILLAAGIWDKWTDQTTGEIINSFAIITDNPCDYILEVGHDRQPVFLNLANADTWLNTEALPAAEAYNFLKNNQEPINYAVSNYKQLKGARQHDLLS